MEKPIQPSKELKSPSKPNANSEYGAAPIKHSSKCNLVVVGSSGSGKTSLIIRFVTDRFTIEYEPTLEDVFSKDFVLDRIAFSLDIVDTAGGCNHYPIYGADGFVIVYSICDESSFKDALNLAHHIRDIRGDVPLFVIGTKCDLDKQRQVSYDRGVAASSELRAKFLETSSLLGTNIDNVFHLLGRQVLESQQAQNKQTFSTATQRTNYEQNSNNNNKEKIKKRKGIYLIKKKGTKCTIM